MNLEEADESQLPSYLIMVVTRDGTVAQCLGQTWPPDVFPTPGTTASLAKLLPDPIGPSLIRKVRYCLKNRASCWLTFDLNHEAGNSHCEATFMLHGRERVLIIIRDTTRLKTAVNQARELAYHDELTGLANQRYLEERFSDALALARLKESHIGLIRFDLDNIRTLNKLHGRAVGDAIIQAMAHRLTARLRKTTGYQRLPDRTDTEGLVIRLVDNKFAILLADVQSSQIENVFNRVSGIFDEAYVCDGHEIGLSASVGLAVYPKDGTSLKELLHRAGIDLKHAKLSESASNPHDDTPLDSARLRGQDLATELREAISQDRLKLYFQPKIGLESRNVVGAETLLRWSHPTRGVISFGQFVPLAEQLGLMTLIGEWVLRGACKLATKLSDLGLGDLSIAVNVTEEQLRNNTFTATAEEILRTSGLPAAALELELSENILMRNTTGVRSTLKSLRDLGVTLAVDDFGTSYSSLSVMKRCGISVLKIDRSIISGLLVNDEEMAVCAAAISMAHRLNLRVVAEGVESAKQICFLRANECDEVQGFFYAEALPEKQLIEFLRTREPSDTLMLDSLEQRQDG